MEIPLDQPWLWIGLAIGVILVVFFSAQKRNAALSVIEQWAKLQNYRIIQIQRVAGPPAWEGNNAYLSFQAVLQNQAGEGKRCRLRILEFSDDPEQVHVIWE